MKFQDGVSILITFLVGMLVGSYLFVTGFATTFSFSTVSDAGVYDEIVITGDSYGACALSNSCLSFQIIGDGSYRALFDVTGERVVYEDTVGRGIRRQFTAFSKEALASSSVPLVVPECRYGEDTNYRFSVTLDGVSYRLDTCRTDIDYEGPVWTTLENTWAAIVAP